MSEHGFSPDVEKLLTEALDDPKSGLLALPKLGKKCLPSQEPIRPLQLDTSLERFLVERHREEVAKLLYLASREVLMAVPLATGRNHWREPSPPREWCASRRGRLGSSQLGISELAVLDRHYQGGPSSPTAYDLARASYALHPIAIGRVQISLCLRSAGRLSEAIELLREPSAIGATPRTRYYALAAMGGLQYDSKRAVQARKCFRASIETGESEPPASAYWMIAALLLGDAADARAAAKVVEHWSSVDHNQFQEVKVVLSAMLADRTIVPSAACADLIAKLSDTLPPSCMEIAHVLA